MANSKEIQNRINSIQDTKKITNAMYMISSMKVRKAKQKLENTEAYFYGLQNGISEILLHFPDMQHIYFDNRPKDMNETVKKKGYLIITGDKGMAGAYNHNVMKEAEAAIKEAEEFRLLVVGEIGRHYFKAQKYNIEENFPYSANNPSIHRARMISEYILELYNNEELDEVYVVYTRMVNSMKQEVEVQQLLPLRTREFVKNELIEESQQKHTQSSEFAKEALEAADDWYLIYPSRKEVLKKLVYNYITGFVYGALVEASASEENSRMQAMQAATDNANDMLRDLTVQYNRVRQAAITQQITEVAGGAKALRNKKQKTK